MQMSFIAAPAQVLARWAYGDMVGANAVVYDTAPDIEALRAKRRSGVGFHELTSSEIESLERLCRAVRAPLVRYVDDVQQFVLRPIDRVALGSLFVPREIEYADRHTSFADYIQKPYTDQSDARAAEPTLGGYKAPVDPLTVGRQSLLLDGYHRAVSFWWFARPGATIEAYVPDRASRFF